MQNANECRRPRQSSVRKTPRCGRQHLLPCQSMLRRVGHGSFYVVDLIRPVYGLDVDAKDLSLMHESMEMHKLNALVGSRVSLTIKKRKRNGYSPRGFALDCMRAYCFRPNFKPATKRRLVHVLHPLFQVVVLYYRCHNGVVRLRNYYYYYYYYYCYYYYYYYYYCYYY